MSDQAKRHPATWIPTLYTTEGLPFVVVNVVSVLMYKSMGLSDAHIALFTSIVTIPWALKPLWGPLIEMFKSKKTFVIFTQFAGGISFGLLALTLGSSNFFTWSLIFFGLAAFNSAVHDTAADGVYLNVLSEAQQARYVSWQGAFYNVGKVLSQGVFVWVAGYLEKLYGVVTAWSMVMTAFGAILVLMGFWHLKFLPDSRRKTQPATMAENVADFRNVFITFFNKTHIWWGIAFLIIYRFAEGQALKIVPLFLRAGRDVGGLGLSTENVGVLYGIFPPIALIVGSMLAGYFTTGHGLRKSLLFLCAAFNLPFVVYTWLAFTQPTNLPTITAWLSLEYLGYGVGFVGLQLFMVQQIAPGPYRMAHYAFATALMQVGMIVPSSISGIISDALGYRHFFVWVMIATIPSFLISWLVPLRNTAEVHGETVDQLEVSHLTIQAPLDSDGKNHPVI